MKLKGNYYPRSFNMGVAREVVEKIGGFGKLRHGQDIEFSNRIIKSGAKVLQSSAFVYHKRRTSIGKCFKQTFNWGVARINLYKIDKDMLCMIHFLPSIATIFFPIFLIQIPLAMIECTIKYRDAKPALWLPLAIPAQTMGYGLGFIYNFIRRIILKKEATVGFYEND